MSDRVLIHAAAEWLLRLLVGQDRPRDIGPLVIYRVEGAK